MSTSKKQLFYIKENQGATRKSFSEMLAKTFKELQVKAIFNLTYLSIFFKEYFIISTEQGQRYLDNVMVMVPTNGLFVNHILILYQNSTPMVVTIRICTKKFVAIY